MRCSHDSCINSTVKKKIRRQQKSLKLSITLCEGFKIETKIFATAMKVGNETCGETVCHAIMNCSFNWTIITRLSPLTYFAGRVFQDVKGPAVVNKSLRTQSKQMDSSLPSSLTTHTNRPSPLISYQSRAGLTLHVPLKTKEHRTKLATVRCLPYFHQFSEGKQERTHNT